MNFTSIEGDLYVGESAVHNDHYSDDADHLYRDAVFQTDQFTVKFYTSIGGYMSVRDTDIETTDVGDVYYPHFNETAVEPYFEDPAEDRELFAEDVHVEYAVVNDNLFIRTQSEITAYGGIYLVVNEDLYKVHAPLLMQASGTFDGDDFLDIPAAENPVRVEHVDTGYSAPISDEEVTALVENDAPNGALKVQSPDNIIARLTDKL